MFFRLFSFLKIIFTLFICAIVCVCAVAPTVTAFPFEGQKEYYLYSPSSQSVIKSSLTLSDLPFLRGESIWLDREGKSTLECEALVAELLAQYEAEVLKKEEFADGVSYYCYSEKLKKGIILDGVTVNLHLVVKENCIALGTPVIFGGY